METIYKIIPNIAESKRLIKTIDERLSPQHYSNPWPHPKGDEALIIYDTRLLGKHNEIEKYPSLTETEATKKGWYIHWFTGYQWSVGRFAKSRVKLEEAQYLYDLLSDTVLKDNRPLFRSLFFAFLSALYSLSETMKSVCEAQGGELSRFYEPHKKKIRNPKDLIGYLIQVVNRDKHNHENYFRYSATRYSIIIPNKYTTIVSAEGDFNLIDEGKKTFRRVFLGLGEGRYNMCLLGVPRMHSSLKVDTNDPVKVSGMALDYFEGLLFDAENIEKKRVENA